MGIRSTTALIADFAKDALIRDAVSVLGKESTVRTAPDPFNPEITTKGIAIHLRYRLIRSKKRRKTISLLIKEDGKIVIYTPYRTPKWEIEKFIQEKQSWIVGKVSEKERRIK